MAKPHPLLRSIAIASALAMAALVSLPAAPAEAGIQQCRKRAARIAGNFAKKRAKQIINCRLNAACGPELLAAKRERLRADFRARLAESCRGLDGHDLDMGGTCPDPTGVCAQDLSTSDGVVDCLLCLAAETLEHLLDVLHGDDVPVAERCGGCVGARCEPGAFCEPPPGVCDAVLDIGMCTKVPEVCPDHFGPVCGCDGRTYENDCERRRHRTGLQHEGACTTVCESDGDCPEGSFCEGLPGLCGAVPQGKCTRIPEACPDHIDPVCGCDGRTYGNDCERRAAGVRLHHKGPCKTVCGVLPFATADDGTVAVPPPPVLPPVEECDEGFYCELPPGLCNQIGVPGECLPQPDACPQIYRPVCGCDGRTYGNDCERMAAGVAKRHDGECERRCGGIAGLPCGPGEVCDPEPGTCGFADQFGQCKPKPQGCPEIYDPVCGCDGQTYANDCERLSAGVILDHHGPCRDHCRAGDHSSCGQGEVCLPPHGECSDRGECVPVPRICPLTASAPFPLLAVCGCDGITYSSSCEAASNGVGVAHPGPCTGDGECLKDADCREGFVCLPLPGICPHLGSGPETSLNLAPPFGLGVCIRLPKECALDADRPAEPVCACDGRTYDMPCRALDSGGGIAYPGPCLPSLP